MRATAPTMRATAPTMRATYGSPAGDKAAASHRSSHERIATASEPSMMLCIYRIYMVPYGTIYRLPYGTRYSTRVHMTCTWCMYSYDRTRVPVPLVPPVTWETARTSPVAGEIIPLHDRSRARSLLVVIVAMTKARNPRSSTIPERKNTLTHCVSARQANAKHDRDDDGDPVPRVCCLQGLMLLRIRQSGRLQSQGGCCSTWADASTLGRCSGCWVFTPVAFSGTRESTRSIQWSPARM